MLEEIKNARQKVSAEADILIADNHTHTYVWTSVQDPYSTCTSFQTRHQICVHKHKHCSTDQEIDAILLTKARCSSRILH